MNPARLRNGRRDMLFVSLAGPMTNFALAVGGGADRTLAVRRARRVRVHLRDLPARVLIPFLFAEVNLFLGVFNFLPIPPLDGAALIERVLPRSWLPRVEPLPAVRDPRALRAGRHAADVLGRGFHPFLDHLDRFVLR